MCEISNIPEMEITLIPAKLGTRISRNESYMLYYDKRKV